ncbi:MAG: hypothetical protein J6U01_03775 [Clostridia bacterium]|nr:hypothetical protein [Clostridia bacterium]
MTVKRVLSGLLALLLIFLPMKTGSRAESRRKLTVMIYMCGSNLESSYGSASADLEEIRTALSGVPEVTALVLAGGSEKWSAGYDPELCSFIEIGARGMRTIHTETRRSMGSGETLAELLRKGKEDFPAENHALILWDHGGGPLEGLCWDELFSMDQLTLSELTGALKEVSFPGGLSWIGFDACLMGSAEVAEALAPYARFMIASQETEPADGWDYRFLREAGKDSDGAETGRRIVDAYFESQEGTRDLLTMACIDLSRIRDLSRSLDHFFESSSRMVTAESFAVFSRFRREASGFGQVVRAVGDRGFDLVDLGDLLSGWGEEAAPVKEALNAAVVYVRSSREAVSGLSVYHPYLNKEQYLKSWLSDYRRISFSPGYRQYVEGFGSLLTGTDPTDWSGMQTAVEGPDDQNRYTFTMPLTDAQRDSLSSADVFVMHDFESFSGDRTVLAPIAVFPAEADAEGRLTASGRIRALYAVEDETGEILRGPISYLLSEDRSYYLVLARYDDTAVTNRSGWYIRNVLFHCEEDPVTGRVEIVRRFVYDKASGGYTNRIAFSEAEASHVYFYLQLRYPPEEDGAMPGFEDWEPYEGYWAGGFELPRKWHLEFREDRLTEQMAAAFQVTDCYQNVWSGSVTGMNNPLTREIGVSPAGKEGEDWKLTFFAQLSSGGENPRLSLRVEAENRGKEGLDFRSDPLILNGIRTAESFISVYNVSAGEKSTDSLAFSGNVLMGLDQIETVSGVIRVGPSDYSSRRPEEVIPFTLSLADCSVSAFAPEMPEALAETTENGLTWKLLSLEEKNDGSLTGTMYVRNDMETSLSQNYQVLVNDVRSESALGVRVAPGTSCISRLTFQNLSKVSSYDVSMDQSDKPYVMGVRQALQHAGWQQVERMSLWPDEQPAVRDKAAATLELNSPWPLSPAEQQPECVPIQTGDVEAKLESVLIADDALALGLRLHNHLDRCVTLKPREAQINETPLSGKVQFTDYWTVLPPHADAVLCAVLETEENFAPGDPVHSLSLCFEADNYRSSPVQIGFPEGTQIGAKGGTYLYANDLTVNAGFLDTSVPYVIADRISARGVAAPVRLTVPLSGEAASEAVSGSAALGVYTRENGKTRFWPLVSRNAERENGNWTVSFSGWMMAFGDQTAEISESVDEENQLTVRNRSSVLVYEKNRHPDPQHPDPDAADRNGFLNAVLAPDGQSVVESNVNLLSLHLDDRTNILISEAAFTLLDRFVLTDTEANGFRSYEVEQDWVTLTADQPLQPELRSIRELNTPQGVLCRFWNEEGEIISSFLLDPETGEMIGPAD